jgi:hypothetical protein
VSEGARPRRLAEPDQRWNGLVALAGAKVVVFRAINCVRGWLKSSSATASAGTPAASVSGPQKLDRLGTMWPLGRFSVTLAQGKVRFRTLTGGSNRSCVSGTQFALGTGAIEDAGGNRAPYCAEDEHLRAAVCLLLKGGSVS